MSAPRWWIAGFGWVARDYMAPAIDAAGGMVVPIADPDPTAQASAKSASIVAYEDAATMLGGTQRDILCVATPNSLHAGAVCAAAGVPVLCEKSVAATLADAEGMFAAVEASGILYGTAFCQWHHPAHAAMRTRIAKGAIGSPTAVRIVYACWVDPLWRTGPGANWRADPEAAGGGAVIDRALHGLDLAEMLLDEPLASLHIALQRRIHDYAVDDGGMLTERTASGTLVSLHVAYNHPEALPRRRLEVVGDAGMLVAGDRNGQTAGGSPTLIDGRTGKEKPTRFDETLSPFIAQARAFAVAVAEERHDYSAAPDIRLMRPMRLMRLFDAAYRDARACL